ncbi:MAG: type II toxin-antitoxin system RelE/ParE family toxin [Gemmobacter sp.]
MKRLSFSIAAQARLDDIYAYSVEHFGRSRAEVYVDVLAERCQGLASGDIPSQACRILVEGRVRTNFRFARAGRHFIMFLDLPSEIRIVDVVHQSANIALRLSQLR